MVHRPLPLGGRARAAEHHQRGPQAQLAGLLHQRCFQPGAFCGVKTWMSDRLAPARRKKTGQPSEPVSEVPTPQRRGPYLLALAWVLVGATLYAVEVVRLVSGLG
jgi:hypothetical protein